MAPPASAPIIINLNPNLNLNLLSQPPLNVWVCVFRLRLRFPACSLERIGKRKPKRLGEIEIERLGLRLRLRLS